METYIWGFITTFGVGLVGVIFGFGKMYQKTNQNEKDIKIAHDRISEVKNQFSEIKETIDENNGYLKALLDKN